MQTSMTLEDLDTKQENQKAWMVLWLRDWSTSNWLMSSFISSIILSEIYAVTLSIYPNFMAALWLSFGITSVTLSSLLTGMTILGFGLITGAVVYSAHLAYQAIRTVEKFYQPLIEIWSTNTRLYAFILQNLLNDDNFLKISKALKDYPPAKPLNEFLKKDENIESVRKILSLLQKIWAQDSIDTSIKTFVITLLSQYVQEENAKQHIDNIWSLIELLQKNEELSLDLIMKAIQNSSQIGPVITQLQNYQSEPDIIKKILEHPELLPYFNSVNKNFEQHAIDIRAENIRSLYFYLKYDVTHANNPTKMNSETNSPQAQFNINHSVFEIIKNQYAKDPHNFVAIWDKLMHHQHLEWIEALVLRINQSPYQQLIQEPSKLLKVLSIYSTLELDTETEKQTLFSRLTVISSESYFDQVIEILKHLDEYQCFHIDLIEHVLLKCDLFSTIELLKAYHSHIYPSTQSAELIRQDIQKLLINNDLLHTQLNAVTNRKLTAEENMVFIMKKYLYPENFPQDNHSQSSDGLTKKKFNPIRKFQKIFHLLPKQQTPSVQSTMINSMASVPIIPELLAPVETVEKTPTQNHEINAAYKHWKMLRERSMFSKDADDHQHTLHTHGL